MSKYRITLDGKVYEMEVELLSGDAPVGVKRDAPKAPVSAPKAAPAQAAAPKAAPKAASGAAGAVLSPMPGTILKLLAGAGETVKAGQAVLVLEAMKMENEIVSPKDGALKAVFVKEGDSVQGGDKLFELE